MKGGGTLQGTLKVHSGQGTFQGTLQGTLQGTFRPRYLQGTLAGGTLQGTLRPRYLQGTLSSKVHCKVHYKVPSRYLGAQGTFKVPWVGVC